VKRGALLRDPAIARLGALSAVSFGFSVILGNWVVTLLQRTAGYGKGAAGAVGSLILILGIAGRPAGGVLARGRPSRTWRAVAASFVVGALATALLALAPSHPLDVLAAILVGAGRRDPVRSHGGGRGTGAPRGRRGRGRGDERISGADDRGGRAAARSELRAAGPRKDRLRGRGGAVAGRARRDPPPRGAGMMERR